MISEDFFETLHKHFNNALPFVVYRKPNDIEVKGLLQNDNAIHEVNDFSDCGFVFAPFDGREKTIVIPLNVSESIKMDFIKTGVSEISHQDFKYVETEKLEHINLVQKGIDAINNKNLLKVVLSRCEVVLLPDDNPITIFKRLLNTYPTAFAYCWYHPKVGLWLGATPETLLQVKGNRFSTMALAGTQLFKGTIDVKWKDKELEEQQIVTNSIFRDLKEKVDVITVSEPKTIKAGSLLHLQTKISGTVLKKLGTVNLQLLLGGLHPTPAVCGFPKENAKQFILKEEKYNREFYTGFLGELNMQEKQTRNTNRKNVENNAYASIKTTSHLFVNLRCMQLKDSQALIYVGGGITKDSNAEQEWQETVNKTLTIKAVLD